MARKKSGKRKGRKVKIIKVMKTCINCGLKNKVPVDKVDCYHCGEEDVLRRK